MTIIPNASFDSHIAILGKTGSGKSNVGAVMAETLMERGDRICYIDPTGTAWGLRLWPNKKPSRFKPVIFGGEHADIQINEHHGALIAEAIASSSDSAIVDTRLMSTSARTRFFTAFAEGLLRTNRSRLHLFVDEAHLFAPQKPTGPQAAAMLSEANELVSRGRSAGLNVTLLSQRPQKLSKDALTQCETLIAMRLIHNLDTKAVDDWVGEWADKEKGREIVASLPGLPVGTGWVWAPSLGHLKKTAFPLAATFDSRKPLARDDDPPELTPLDATALGEKMDTIRQQAMENDPRRLKAQIAELEKQRKELLDHPVMAGFTAADVQNSYNEGYTKGVTAQRDWSVTAVSQAFKELLPMVEGTVPTPVPTQQKPAPIAAPIRTPAPKLHKAGNAPQIVAQAGESPPIVAHANGFSVPQMRVLTSLSMWRALGHDAPTKPMVAMCAGYSHTSGGFGNLLSQLNTAGAIEYPQAGKIRLLAGVDTGSPTDARDAMLGKLTNPQRKLIDALHDGGEMSKADLGAATAYSPTSGGFGNLLSQLRSLGLIDYPSTGRIALEPWLEEIL